MPPIIPRSAFDEMLRNLRKDTLLAVLKGLPPKGAITFGVEASTRRLIEAELERRQQQGMSMKMEQGHSN